MTNRLQPPLGVAFEFPSGNPSVFGWCQEADTVRYLLDQFGTSMLEIDGLSPLVRAIAEAALVKPPGWGRQFADPTEQLTHDANMLLCLPPVINRAQEQALRITVPGQGEIVALRRSEDPLWVAVADMARLQ